MALIKCKECGTEVSSTAETCPKCDARVAAKPMDSGTIIGACFIGAIIILVFFGIMSSGTRNDTSSQPTNPPATSDDQAVTTSDAQTASTPTPTLPGSQWDYSQYVDKMGKGTNYVALVSSSNTVNFSEPYSGPQYGILMLRTHPRLGKDIMLRIERGQFLCPSYQGCTVLVRFDDEEAGKYPAAGPADNSSEMIFIENYSRFMGKMLKAKRVRIAAEIYQEGAPVFEFDVSGFDQSKYKPKK